MPSSSSKAKLIASDILGRASVASIGDSLIDNELIRNMDDDEIVRLGTRCNKRKPGTGGKSPTTKKRGCENELLSVVSTVATKIGKMADVLIAQPPLTLLL